MYLVQKRCANTPNCLWLSYGTYDTFDQAVHVAEVLNERNHVCRILEIKLVYRD